MDLSLIDTLKRNAPLSDSQIVKLEIKEFIESERYKNMLIGARYYAGKHDILDTKRMAIGKDGLLTEVKNVANNKIVHTFATELIDQKIQYLLGREFSVKGLDQTKDDILQSVFDTKARSQITDCATGAIKCGIGWMYIYPEKGQLKFKVIDAKQIIPLWGDDEHTDLQALIRFYTQVEFEAAQKRFVTYAEFWQADGVQLYKYQQTASSVEMIAQNYNSNLIAVGEKVAMLQDADGNLHDWERLPFVPIKYNDSETPLISRIKSLIDAYDKGVSNNGNALEDAGNKIIKVKNYGGSGKDSDQLGRLRQTVNAYRLIMVNDDGDAETIDDSVDVSNSDTYLDRLRRNIYAFGRGVDPEQAMGANASAEARQYMYAPLDLDCNGLEKGVRNCIDGICWFIDKYYSVSGDVEITFNRDILINEQSAIDMCLKAQSIEGISTETILSNMPWVKDVAAEIDKYKSEQGDIYNNLDGDPNAAQ